ncbi:hypothetical protein [Derxia lacustris]|uniref:hypothetical protein n=1 Tax=Derxia lacustris TaxID=764842 RepID=UPI000A16F021|nr:hypothetical protein [Derxia lacustris]
MTATARLDSTELGFALARLTLWGDELARCLPAGGGYSGVARARLAPWVGADAGDRLPTGAENAAALTGRLDRLLHALLAAERGLAVDLGAQASAAGRDELAHQLACVAMAIDATQAALALLPAREQASGWRAQRLNARSRQAGELRRFGPQAGMPAINADWSGLAPGRL